ncbi:hypothetical protein D9757_013209 [Collybiopsis confluens]|uniref:Thioester reductase (TE) domain-containing protein n=1 Tax=Collybiopsis confluens TaxID=2823264 RepID=A0A8H5G1L4_9AGAR|nr:hypothetical protein D9757_013209 [Collybiopsis confluens]
MTPITNKASVVEITDYKYTTCSTSSGRTNLSSNFMGFFHSTFQVRCSTHGPTTAYSGTCRLDTGDCSLSKQMRAIESMIEKYTAGLDNDIDSLMHPVQVLDRNTKHRSLSAETILLTGSTGNLGSQLLVDLLSRDNIQRVYAVNRPSSTQSMMQRHSDRFIDKGLDVSLLASAKLVFLEGDISLPDLGLSKFVLDEMRQDLTMIIHNAWTFGFRKTLPFFEDHVKGTRTLIDLARSSVQSEHLRFLFASTCSAMQSWDERKGPYPEKLISDAKHAVGSGYGESKYIAERILAKSGLRAASFRIGQISGLKSNGAWPIHEWIPATVNAALRLGSLPIPNKEYQCRWIPMATTSKAILEIGFTEGALPFAVNLQHPQAISGKILMRGLQKMIVQELRLPSDSLPLVPHEEWIASLEKSASVMKSHRYIQVIAKVHDRLPPDSPEMDLTQAMRLSETMRTLAPIENSDIEKWVLYWVKSGFLDRSMLHAWRNKDEDPSHL